MDIHTIQSSVRSVCTSCCTYKAAVESEECHAHVQSVHSKLFSIEEEEEMRRLSDRGLEAMTDKLESGRAVLPYLEMLVVDKACSDPGAPVVNEVMLPILQERIERRAREHAARKRKEAFMRAEVRESVSTLLWQYASLHLLRANPNLL